MHRGTDESFARKLYDNLAKSSKFIATSRERGMHKFSIVHYAGVACYDTKGFCDKNKV